MTPRCPPGSDLAAPRRVSTSPSRGSGRRSGLTPHGAGPSDDGHLVINGVNAAIPLNPRARSRFAAAECCSTARTRAGRRTRGAAQVLRPGHRRRHLLREDRQAARPQCAGHHGRSDLHSLRRGRALPILRDRGVVAAGATTAVKPPAELAEVAEAAVRLDGITQMVMTTGTSARRRPWCPAPRPVRACGERRLPRAADPGSVRTTRRTCSHHRTARGGRHADRHPRRVAGRRGPAPLDAWQGAPCR